MSWRQRRAARLSAYLDGELRPGAARRLARRLERSPELREEVGRLRELGELVRESQEAAAAPEQDLWERIGRGLPAIDAALAERPRPRARQRGLPGGLARPLTAGLVVAGVAAVLAFGLLRPGLGPAPTSDVVHWLDAEGEPVLILQGDDGTTIIWMLDPAPTPERLSGGGMRGVT